MTLPESEPSPVETDVSFPRVKVRYWAAAKAAAGRAEDEVRAATVATALGAAAAQHTDAPRYAQVLSVCSFLLGDQPLGGQDLAAVPVSDGDVIEVLPPFAGGSRLVRTS
jgi:molybdopterin converting factor small subunit